MITQIEPELYSLKHITTFIGDSNIRLQGLMEDIDTKSFIPHEGIFEPMRQAIDNECNYKFYNFIGDRHGI